MAEYIHGVRAEQILDQQYAADHLNSRSVPVYVGTLPVHTTAGGAARVNTPILLTDFAQAVRMVGYSEDWESYTLCEAIWVHLMMLGTGPICVINVFNPAEGAKEATATLNAKNNRVVISGAGDAILDTVKVTGVEAGNYTATYDYASETITLRGTSADALTGEVTVTYKKALPSGVTDTMVIGSTDGEGTETGMHLIRRVYQETGLIPSRLLAPGFTQNPKVREAMLSLSTKVSGHFDAFIYTDIPLADSEGTAIKPSAVAAWKENNGYNADNEKVHWPMWKGTDGRVYHLSVMDAAILQRIESETDGIPYRTSSNREMPIGGRLYFGEDSKVSLDEEKVNAMLGANGIVSAIYHGGRWVLWGAHTASYTQSSQDGSNVSETNLAMMFYITNDFQVRRAEDIDKPMSRNRISQIVAEEQAMLDALCGTGALLYGKARIGSAATDDYANGDFSIDWEITQTPNTKSITGRAYHTDEGLMTLYEEV